MFPQSFKRGGSKGIVIAIIVIIIIAAIVLIGMKNKSDEPVPSDDETSNAVTLSLDLMAGTQTLGAATLVEENGNTKVILALADAAGTHPAHIHTGTCGSNGAIKYQLSPVTGGTSETVLSGVTIASLLSAPAYVNTHKSASDLGEFACSNVKGVVSSATQ